MSLPVSLAMNLTEKGVLPDQLIRQGIRRLLGQRLKQITLPNLELQNQSLQQFIAAMDQAEIAPLPEKANEQHYEVPAEFFYTVLGPQRKYSCCYWDEETTSLAHAESRSLELTAEHAQLDNHQTILELGCGWGSLTLWMAEHYPDSHITAVSNSTSQADFIRQQMQMRNLSNINIITADMNDFDIAQTFDRIVSIEMFEHMRNYRQLYQRVANWLKPDGKFFKHIFINREVPYVFEDRDQSDWMSRYFFSGGMMPSADLPLWFQEDLSIENRWFWNGEHYARTSNAWLDNMDDARQQLWPLFEKVYGEDFAGLWWQRWRLFFMACAELFAYQKGNQWLVGHYLFSRRDQ